MADIYKTPKGKLRSALDSSIQSTPGDPRASATSHTLNTYYADDIRPLLEEDVKRFKLGSLDRYLYRILRAVNAIPAPTGEAKGATRPTEQVIKKGLQECLDKVKDVVDTNSAEWKAIQDAFTEYANANGETDRYPHFVNAANRILALLKRVDIEGLRKLPTKADEEIQFVVHDSRPITSTHNGRPYVRKPDIVVAREKFISPLYRPASSKAQESASPESPASPKSLASAEAPASPETPASPGAPGSPATTADPETPACHDAQDPIPLEALQSAPPVYLPWEKGLMFVEFKKKRSQGTLKKPAEWNPRIGSAGVGSYEKPKDIDEEEQDLLEDIAKAKAKQIRECSSSALRMRSTSRAASSSAKPSTTQPSRQSVRNKQPSSHPSRGSIRQKSAASQTASSSRASQQSNKSKRKAPSDDQGPQPKKVKVSEQKQDKVLFDSATPAAIQLADYAAEALYNAFGRSHVLGLLVKDATINVWHFDHEDILQMTGFDFLKDQHYLFLLLLALQRFNDKDWGFLPGFEQLIAKDNIKLDLTDDWVDNPNMVEQTFNGEKAKMIKPPFGLGGRATGVMYGSVGDKKVVGKLAWPEKNRNREKEFVDEARKRFDAMKLPDYDPGEYLPEIFAAREYTEFESGPLRAAVLQNESEYEMIKLGSRIPYLIVMPEYEPIATLTRNWDQFMVAFFALFYCHAMLWSIGIRHGDISESNLMWDPVGKKPKLCDFDLSHFCEPPQIGVPEKGPDGPKGLCNTGTWIFMADELLTGEAMEGSVKRVYRHEVEAFVAVLVWIACRYKDGEVRPGRPLEHWNQGSYLLVKDNRARTFNEIRNQRYPMPDSLPESVWVLIRAALRRMNGHRGTLAQLLVVLGELKDYPGSNDPPEEMPEDFDDLRTLRNKMLSWPIFTDPSAAVFAKLMKERILNPGKQQETMT